MYNYMHLHNNELLNKTLNQLKVLYMDKQLVVVSDPLNPVKIWLNFRPYI